jgi:hypothetical protein
MLRIYSLKKKKLREKPELSQHSQGPQTKRRSALVALDETCYPR